MIEINNLSRTKISTSKVLKVINFIFKKEKIKLPSVSVAFISESEMLKLNNKYKKKKKPTDVLTFNNLFGDSLGEIVLCPSQIRKNAKKYGCDFNEELKRVLIHGVLHVIGYDHEKDSGKMLKKEQEYVSFFKKLCLKI